MYVSHVRNQKGDGPRDVALSSFPYFETSFARLFFGLASRVRDCTGTKHHLLRKSTAHVHAGKLRDSPILLRICLRQSFHGLVREAQEAFRQMTWLHGAGLCNREMFACRQGTQPANSKARNEWHLGMRLGCVRNQHRFLIYIYITLFEETV